MRKIACILLGSCDGVRARGNASWFEKRHSEPYPIESTPNVSQVHIHMCDCAVQPWPLSAPCMRLHGTSFLSKRKGGLPIHHMPRTPAVRLDEVRLVLLELLGGRYMQPEWFSGASTCRAALRLQKGMSGRSLNFLKSGSLMVCCSVSHPTSASGSLVSILRTETPACHFSFCKLCPSTYAQLKSYHHCN